MPDADEVERKVGCYYNNTCICITPLIFIPLL